MRKTTIAVLTALMMVLATVATASPSEQGYESRSTVSVVPVNRIFDDIGTPVGPTASGRSLLITREESLRAVTSFNGLKPGGVYTFWWVIIPSGGGFPADAFVAGGGGTVVGDNGRAFANMSAREGDGSIAGFLIPFQPLDFDLRTAEIHVELAYHGQASDAGSDLGVWLSDFWSGSACPGGHGNNPYASAALAGATEVNPGQPHCPVSYAAVHPGS